MKTKSILKRGVLLLLALLIALYLLLLAGLWAMQDRLLFGRRSSEIGETPASRNWACEEVWAEVDGNKTHGWWLPVPGARITVLFAHGSGRNISGYLDDAALFRDLGLSVLLYDYGGYGLSTGKPSEARCYADGRAMWAYLVQASGIAPESILLAGSSMGSGITAELATQVSPAAVILESAFTSIPDTVWNAYPYFPANWLCHTQFRNIDKVAHIHAPVLVVHSKDDTVVPFEHGQQLYQSVTAPKMFLEIHGAHYGGKFASREIYSAGVKAFISQYKIGQ